MKAEDILNFIESLERKYGKKVVMEITITREAGFSLIEDCFPAACRNPFIFFLDVDDRPNWKDFQMQTYRYAITIKNGEYKPCTSSPDSASSPMTPPAKQN